MGITIPFSSGRIKIIVILILFLTAIVFGIILLLPSHINISKSILINAGKERISPQLSDLNNWRNWFPVFQDKNIKINISGKNNDQEAIITNGDKTLKFVLSKKNKDSIYADVFGNSFNETYQFTLLTKGDQTEVKWSVYFTFNKYSFRKLAGLFIYQVKNHQYQDILINLKNYIEKGY